MGKITIEVPWDIGELEAVDAIASLALKKRHKQYGEWMRRLAEIVKREVNPPKGDWQRYWTLATYAFQYLYRGWDSRQVANYVAPLARELRIRDYQKLVDAISRNMDYILGKHSRYEETGTAGGRR
jgi:ABC-type Zn uptake system ZnuABC Zn-binding protein ZnuA